MSIDTTELSKLAMELIETLAEEYENQTDVSIGIAGLVFEVHGTDPDYPDVPYTDIRYRCTDSRGWIQEALFNNGARGARNQPSVADLKNREQEED